MIFSFGILTGLAIAILSHAFTRTRTYGRIVRWIWTADVRQSDPHLYGKGARMTTPRHTGGYLDPSKQTLVIDAGCIIPGLADLKPPADVLEKLAHSSHPTPAGQP